MRKQRLNSISVTTKRASTAVGGGKGSTQANTALTHYNDLPQQQQDQSMLLLNHSHIMANSSNSFAVNQHKGGARAATSHSHNRRGNNRLDQSQLPPAS